MECHYISQCKAIKKKLLNKAYKLEVHRYAPEMNTIHFMNGTSIKCGWSIAQQYNYTIDNSLDLVLHDLVTNNKYEQYIK